MEYKFDGEKVFFTSDTHFGHKNIIKYCNRPFKDTEEMNETIISNWNRVVDKDDIVFHLGDFGFGDPGKWANILDRLNGKIYLVVGNHDPRSITEGCRDRFEEVAMQMYIEIGKRKIYLNHCPLLCYGGADKDTWQLFGHVHSGPYSTNLDTPRLTMLYPTQYDVGVDNNNFTPVSYKEVRAIILKQIEEAKKMPGCRNDISPTDTNQAKLP